MAKKKRKKKNAEELNEENEFLKLKMMAEFGGKFVGNENIPPDVENQFLKQIMQFHRQHETSQMVSVYKFIGEPEYNHVHDMSDREVKRELKRLTRLMNKHGIGLDVLAPTPEREIYRFITEELFKHEIENVKMKGWLSQFIYEEFYPNAEYDVKNAAHYGILAIFDAQAPFMEEYFAEDMKDNLGLSSDAEELKEKIQRFRSGFNDILLVNYDFLKVDIDKNNGTAHVYGDVTYKTQKQKGKRTKRETTTIEIFLKRHENISSIWEITRIITDVI